MVTMETEPGDVFSAAMVTVIGPLILIGLGLTVALMGNRIARLLYRAYGEIFGERTTQPRRALSVSNVTFVGVSSAVVGLGFLVIGVWRLAA